MDDYVYLMIDALGTSILKKKDIVIVLMDGSSVNGRDSISIIETNT